MTHSLKEILGPDNAVNGLRRCVSDGAPWESLLGGLRLALITLCQSLIIHERATQTNIYWTGLTDKRYYNK